MLFLLKMRFRIKPTQNQILMKKLFYIAIIFSLLSCSNNNSKKDTSVKTDTSNFHIAGAMKNVMWKGELGGIIRFDTIQNKKGLYGLGPESYLTGELLINDGLTYVSRVLTDTSMTVEQTDTVSAPFFVYANVNDWKEVTLPNGIHNIETIEKFINEQTKDAKRPFAFKLIGEVEKVDIHIQNLPKGTKVSSPKEAHQGQTNYEISDRAVEIIGFFSTEHQAVFTHHDTYVHMHLITQDKKAMGHLDAVEIDAKRMKLYLPVE